MRSKKAGNDTPMSALPLFALMQPEPVRPATPAPIPVAPVTPPPAAPQPPAGEVPDLLPLYLEHLNVRVLSEKHIEHCRQHIADCARVLAMPLARMTKHDLKRYGAHLARRMQAGEIKASTVRKYQASIRGLFKWAVADDHLPVNPAESAFMPPKLPKRLPKFLNADELAALMDAAGRGRYPERDRALLALLAMCGLRIAEALSRDWDHFEAGYVTVIGKNDKERRVPVPAALLPHLDAWRAVHPHGGVGAVFTCGVEPYHRLKYDADWRKHLPVLVKSAGLKRRVTSHHLRHTYATNLLRSGLVPLDQIQKLLGHSDISTTGIYAATHIGDDTVAGINAATPAI
jgi:integrase/recombinase XerC